MRLYFVKTIGEYNTLFTSLDAVLLKKITAAKQKYIFDGVDAITMLNNVRIWNN